MNFLFDRKSQLEKKLNFLRENKRNYKTNKRKDIQIHCFSKITKTIVENIGTDEEYLSNLSNLMDILIDRNTDDITKEDILSLTDEMIDSIGTTKVSISQTPKLTRSLHKYIDSSEI